MAVLLTILKIIGIVLLIILLFIILAVLCILFCPVRYYIEGQKKESTYLTFKITWLFPVIYIKVGYEKDLYTRIRLFGIKVFDSMKEELKQQKRKKQKKKRPKKNKPSKEEDALKEPTATKEPDMPKENLNNTDAKQNLQIEDIEERTKNDEDYEQEFSDFGSKIRLFIKKIFEIVKNIKYTIIKWKKSVLAFKEKILQIKATKDWYVEVFSREESKRALQKGKDILVKILKHIAPKKGSGKIEFGFEDPATTGEVLGIISMFYAFYGNHIDIIPNFENINMFEADFYIKGRIRVFFLLKCAWIVFFDKDIRQLYETLTGGRSSE